MTKRLEILLPDGEHKRRDVDMPPPEAATIENIIHCLIDYARAVGHQNLDIANGLANAADKLRDGLLAPRHPADVLRDLAFPRTRWPDNPPTQPVGSDYLRRTPGVKASGKDNR